MRCRRNEKVGNHSPSQLNVPLLNRCKFPLVYISDEPEVPLATYTFTLERKSKKTRYAVGALDLRALLQLKEFNIFQKWFTIIEVEDSKRRVDFFLKKMGYGPSTLSNNFVNVPRINLKG